MKIAVLLLALIIPASAEDNLFTLGVDTRCLYGLAPCWGKVREPVSMVEGVEWVSDTAESTAWTGQFKTAGGKLPDIAAIKEMIHRFNGDQFSYRALEGTLVGKVEKVGGVVTFKSDAGDVVRLGGLREKVQWDVKSRRPFTISGAEKTAFSKLKVGAKAAARAVKVTGPLRAESTGWVMEVREFNWR
jgi:galactose oxidase